MAKKTTTAAPAAAEPKQTKEPKRKSAAEAAHEVLAHKSDVEPITKGEFVKFLEAVESR
jgi:membrane-associated HD superfamily phosphohydrolase